MGADDAHALALEDRREADEQAVVAAAKQLRELGRAPDRAPVEPQVGKFRPSDRADHRHLADAAGFERGEQFADLAHPHPDMRVGLDGGIGGADDADQEGLAPGPAGVGRDLERKGAGAAQDGERSAGGGCRRPAGQRAHASSPLPSRGTQTARSPPCAEEGDDLLHRLLVGEGLGDVADALLERPLAEKQRPVGAPEFVDRLVREPAPLEADDIEAGERGAVAERHAERDEVVLDARRGRRRRHARRCERTGAPPRRR